ncbi:MAG TPA: amidohydrolase family protein, partial [Candidatus Krumholzibacterium sp.]|nr:amidohydrolase family protein [Candidatus Krumholzibacterium sp.]
METIRIPRLRDAHSHPSLYAVLRGALDLGDASGREEALGMIRAATRPGTPAHGGDLLAYNWNDSRLSITAGDLGGMGSVFVCGSSLHNHLMSDEAKERFRPGWKDTVDNIGDSRWVERNLPKILGLMIAMKGLSTQEVEGFYRELLVRGVWYAEEMLVPGPEFISMIDEAGLAGRTAFWADPGTFREMGPEDRARIRGLKIWADGALGAGTAALTVPYLDGSEGFLIYEDGEVAQLVREAGEAGKAIAIHALGDAADEQVLRVLEVL